MICTELVIWKEDGSRYREVFGGVDLTTIRRDWEAASPASARYRCRMMRGGRCGLIWTQPRMNPWI